MLRVGGDDFEIAPELPDGQSASGELGQSADAANQFETAPESRDDQAVLLALKLVADSGNVESQFAHARQCPDDQNAAYLKRAVDSDHVGM
jgi:hypothetical protein